MYQEFYEAINQQIDRLAERKLSLDHAADARPGPVAQNANLSPETPGGYVSDKASLQVQSARHLQISDRIETTADTDPTTSNLFQEVKYMIDHQLWMMRAHMK